MKLEFHDQKPKWENSFSFIRCNGKQKYEKCSLLLLAKDRLHGIDKISCVNVLVHHCHLCRFGGVNDQIKM